MPFQLVKTCQLTEINSVGYLYEHTKTKSQVMFVLNDDDNTAFSIAFETPPYDNNGIAHILEHSVLCGSQKYPTKEPFVELAKGSLNTFLNAMTSSDRTVYPVASCNKKDFKNLMDVYLDAVFFPLLLNNPQVLEQEGWHYHLESKDDDLIYKGVVYNEMKGAYSNPNVVLFHASKKALFPDTIYAYESGGFPLNIPSLTQDDFINFHQTYYHPSNAFTFIYGNVDVDEQLAHLNRYFEQFDYKEMAPVALLQSPFNEPVEKTVYYSVSQDESTQQKTYLSLEWVIGETKNTKDFVYYSILSDILIGSNASPLWQNLMQSGIGADVDGGINTYTSQMTFDISVSNSEAEHVETFKQIIFETLQQLYTNGIDPTLVKAAVNKNKFLLKEASLQAGYPKGVYYSFSATNEWQYGGQPFGSFFTEDILNDIESNPDAFTPLLKALLNNTHYACVIGVPKQGMNDRIFADVHDELQHFKQTLTDAELDAIIDQTTQLQNAQNTPDTPEALETIPLLTLDDINPMSPLVTMQQEVIDDTTYLYHDAFTSGINYLAYYFDTKHVATQDISYIQLFAKLLGHLPTDTYTIEQLATLQDLHTGGIHFSTNIFVETKQPTVYHPKLVVKAKAFENEFEQTIHLTHDMLLHTQFNHKDKLLEQLLKLKAHQESKFMTQSHLCAIYRVRSYYAQNGQYEELLNGIDYYEFLCDVVEHFEQRYDVIVEKLNAIKQALINRYNLTIGFTGQLETNKQPLQALKQHIALLPYTVVTPAPFEKALDVLNEGFILAQDVQYVAKGYNYTLQNIAYDSQLRVLKTLLTYNYLWQEIRVKGGAYGAFNVQTRHGDFLFGSYRDPNLQETLTTYHNTKTFIDQLQLDERELTKAIIGSFSELDRPLSAKETGEVGFMRHFTKTTQEDIQNERTHLLQTTVDSLKTLATHVDCSMSQTMHCVFGNKQMIESQKQLFKTITTLIK